MVRRTFLFALLLMFTAGVLNAQHCLRGKVVDADRRNPLAFVHVLVNDGESGVTTDIDGKFYVCSDDPPENIRFSYVGYETYVMEDFPEDEALFVLLEPVEYQLHEVEVFPTENPAHRIIINAVENRKLNDPESLEAFTYTSYDKMIFSLEPDSLMQIDSMVFDTADSETREFLEKHHLFMMESVSERKYMRPGLNKEEVIATRISGFKDPIFVFLISQMQSTSFYEERISISDKNYINPISRGSTGKYFFLLRDTTYTDRGDSVFIISYRPRKKTNFDGLRGVLSINSNKWAIQNVIAEPARKESGISMRIEQMYEMIDGETWFPVQLKTEVYVGGLMVSDSTMEVGVGSDSTNVDFPIGIGKSYIRDINLNPELKRRHFDHIEVEVMPDASEKDEKFWEYYRIDSLSFKEKNTYAFLDSIGDEYNFDEVAKTFETLLVGEIPWGKFNLDLDEFIHYNGYEGLYLGLGGHTNKKLSRWFRMGGYWGYGFKDKTAKYGGNLNLLLNRYRELEAGFAYDFNVMESGGVNFYDERDNILYPENFRDFLIKRMNLYERWQARVSFRALNWFKVHLGFGESAKEAYRDYRFGTVGENASLMLNEFRFTELTAGFRFAYREKFVQTMNTRVSLGTKFPIVQFKYTRGFNDLLNGEFEYDRFDLQIDESFYSKYLGETKIRLRAGYIDGNIPYCNLYNGNGSYRSFTIFAPFSFATMRMNEFLSNKYLALYLTHNFGELLIRNENFSPEFVISSNFAIGWLDNPGMHHNSDFKIMDKGYFESGLLINDLLNLQIYQLGLGAYYRYGPYAYDQVMKNFAWKLSITFPF